MSAVSNPAVSVVIANYNREKFLGSAIRSALRQTLSNIEIIVVDNASTDGSARVAQRYVESDDRVRFISLKSNAGPAGGRNAALAVARGTWIAVLDSDDFIHPERLERLVAEAERTGAEVCADDLVVFGAGIEPSGFLSARQRRLSWVTLPEYVASNVMLAREPLLGYLKPIFKRAFLDDHKITYDTSLPIGEDYDLVARALASGAKFRLIDDLGYFYRKHPQSTSHRLSQNPLVAMLPAEDRLQAQVKEISPELSRAFARRSRSIKNALAFDECVAALKRRSWSDAAQIAWRNPGVIPLFRLPIEARLKRLLPAHRPQPVKTQKRACLISRQRLAGSVNGSSAYLLGICKALQDSGYRVTLVSPHPGTFGRWPFFFLGPEMNVFSEVFMRGALRIGKRLHIAKDPRVFLAAAKAVVARFAARAGIKLPGWDRPAPYVIGAPWDHEQFLYVSRFAPAGADLVIADYAFASPAIPFALAEDAPSLVVMHDLLSARASRFREKGLVDSVATLNEEEEMRLLGEADGVIAIQDVEAKTVQAALPAHPVLLTPLAHETVAAPQPGQGRTLLFVGSNTAPNVFGLKWFIEDIWPLVLAKVPDCELKVAGGVAAAFPTDYPQVRFLGPVPSLTNLYSEAGVVISPLTVGSGLKIKIGEALSHGKAVVATAVSVEGISSDVVSKIDVHDEPAGFSEAIIELLLDDAHRASRAREAFEAYRRRYSPENCYRELLDYLANPAPIETTVKPVAVETKTLERFCLL